MAEFPALPFWTDAYLADTIHLNTREHGAYLLLLITAWRTADCALPDDDKLLARYARMDMRGWRSMRPVLEQFFKIENGSWTQKRLQKERKYVEDLSRKNSENVRARWLKNKDSGDTTVIPDVYQTDTPTPTPTPIEDTLPNGKDAEASSDLDALLYRRGRELLGKNQGAMITKLKRATGSVGSALEALEVARRKDEPRKYVAGICANKNPQSPVLDALDKAFDEMEAAK